MKTFIEYLKTMAVSGSGVVVSLTVTAILTEFVFGREKYFTAYLIGVVVAVVYAFVLLVKRVFHTEGHRTRRFLLFSMYMILLVIIQTVSVTMLVDMFGTDWYLPVIAGVIGGMSVISYGVYKYVIFR